MLNGRRWWGAKRSSILRSNAARALGVVGTDRARVELEKAASDRKAPVKVAVRSALRSLDEDSDERMRVADEGLSDPAPEADE